MLGMYWALTFIMMVGFCLNLLLARKDVTKVSFDSLNGVREKLMDSGHTYTWCWIKIRRCQLATSWLGRLFRTFKMFQEHQREVQAEV